MTEMVFEPGSFRDRHARVIVQGDRILRSLDADAYLQWKALCETDFFKKGVSSGQIVETVEIPASDLPSGAEKLADGVKAALEHKRIPFLCWPYEWSHSMMRDAALLTLDLMLSALKEGFTLKDATPYNIQWRGVVPVFIDIPSFRKIEPGEPWDGYRQFCRQFLYPLMVESFWKLPFRPFLRGKIDGIDAADMVRLLKLRDRFRRGVFSHVSMQALLDKRIAASEQRAVHASGVGARSDDRTGSKPLTETNPKNDDSTKSVDSRSGKDPGSADVMSPKKVSLREEIRNAGFSSEMIARNVRNLRNTVAALKGPDVQSMWSSYGDLCTYGEKERTIKHSFVRTALEDMSSVKLVWDLGCNTGEYSHLAAEYADYVLAVDADADAIEALYRKLRSEKGTGMANTAEKHKDDAMNRSDDWQRILPVVQDLADPSPSLGWRAMERQAFEKRGNPDLVLSLALIHHLVIASNVPVEEAVEFLLRPGSRLVIEFVELHDPMVVKLLENRKDPVPDYNREFFEACLQRQGTVLRTESIDGRRILYDVQA